MRYILPLLLSATSVACAEPSADLEPATEAAAPSGADADDDETSESPKAPEAQPLPPWGWVETQASPITPFCSVALVGPLTAVTATTCIEGQGAWELTVGFGAATEGVEVAELHPLEHDARLTVLQLVTSPPGATPADLAPPQPGASVRGVSQLYTAIGEPRRHWYWNGIVSEEAPDRVRVDSAGHPTGEAPNCHGDLGSPMFDEAGALVGITVAAHTGEHPCANAFSIVAVTEADDAFDEALERNR